MSEPGFPEGSVYLSNQDSALWRPLIPSTLAACCLSMKQPKERRSSQTHFQKTRGTWAHAASFAIQIRFAPIFKQGVNMLHCWFAHHLAVFLFFFCEETHCQHLVMHSCTDAGARAELRFARSEKQTANQLIYWCCTRWLPPAGLVILTRAGYWLLCSNNPSLELYFNLWPFAPQITREPWFNNMVTLNGTKAMAALWCQYSKATLHH